MDSRSTASANNDNQFQYVILDIHTYRYSQYILIKNAEYISNNHINTFGYRYLTATKGRGAFTGFRR